MAAAAPDASAAAVDAPPTTRLVKGLRELLSAGRYTGIFLDQFGVLHDGKNAYPRAAEAIRRAAVEAGLKVVVVSNSSRRSSGALARLETLGFDRAWFCGAVTSGEITHQALELEGGEVKEEDAAWATIEEDDEGGQKRRRRRRRTKVLHLTWAGRATAPGSGGGVSLPDGYTTVGDDADAAELIVAHGTEGVAAASSSSDAGAASSPPPPIPTPLPELERLLKRAAERRPQPPPMVVANPDFVTVDGPGRLAVMPGTLARCYASAGGGPVVLMGKPSGRIYRAARALAVNGAASDAPSSTRERWLAVGDSLEHDVAGAAAAARELGQGVEVDALFVAAGIHADEVGFVPPADLGEGNGGVVEGAWGLMAAGGGEAPSALNELCARLGVEPPAYATGYLEW
jgi:ribonucleotide monophosphatase NagD (HAD superfamily)